MVRAATGLDAIDRIEQVEEKQGRGPVNRDATDVEQVWENAGH